MQTVYVGLSGGVDSSVTAAVLKEQGYNVVGVYMKNWTQDFEGIDCPWKVDLADAKAVAAKLDIPFKVFDFQAQYKQKVVDYMVGEYQAGRTPNPDVMCNAEIKFKLFLDTALEDGADMIATGHYARVKDGRLYAGVDTNKDQSYFLYRVSKDALDKVIMPVGELEKPAVRAKAAKPDSQGICFVAEVGIHEFLSQYVQTQPGDILDSEGNVLGQHDGAIYYTIGQRHGLGVGGGKPYYVIGKDMAANTVTVTDNPDDLELHTAEFTIKDLHWVGEAPDLGKTYRVRSRYRAKLIDCTLEKVDGGLRVKMAEKERAVSPGQSAVLYDGELVLGGGIIAV
jgi:tRNA-specific 2-thiouridylase